MHVGRTERRLRRCDNSLFFFFKHALAWWGREAIGMRSNKHEVSLKGLLQPCLFPFMKSETALIKRKAWDKNESMGAVCATCSRTDGGGSDRLGRFGGSSMLRLVSCGQLSFSLTQTHCLKYGNG